MSDNATTTVQTAAGPLITPAPWTGLMPAGVYIATVSAVKGRKCQPTKEHPEGATYIELSTKLDGRPEIIKLWTTNTASTKKDGTITTVRQKTLDQLGEVFGISTKDFSEVPKIVGKECSVKVIHGIDRNGYQQVRHFVNRIDAEIGFDDFDAPASPAAKKADDVDWT